MSNLFLIVASNIAVSILLACFALLVGRYGRNPVIAHALWVAVFVKLITPPIVPAPIDVPRDWITPLASVTGWLNSHEHSQLIATESNEFSSGAEETLFNIRLTSIEQFVVRTPTLADAMLCSAVLGTIVIIVRGLLRYSRFSVLLHREGVVDQEATEIVRSFVQIRFLNREKNLTKFVPPVRLISARVSPMLFGVGQDTCIVCPERLWRTLSDGQRRAFLAHEVAHYLRRDHWIRWLEWLVTAAYWWFPLVIIARQQLERHEEAACDAWAISNLEIAPRAYAETLLTVVDFLSNAKVCTPRLASPMKSSEFLEERLRRIMSSANSPRKIRSCGLPTLVICGSLLVHPFPVFVAHASSRQVMRQLPSVPAANASEESSGYWKPMESGESIGDSDFIALPPTPRGWWNEVPEQAWADLRINTHGLRLVARVGSGLELQLGDAHHRFESNEMRAVAYIAASRRLVIGNAIGELHLWDPGSMQSVSLIGSHRAPITSIAFHAEGGLVSGDRHGNLIRWDLQSGQILDHVLVGAPVYSARWSTTGRELLVVANDWPTVDRSSQLISFDGSSLRMNSTRDLPATVASVSHDPALGWLSIDWTGRVQSLVTGEFICSIPKARVSGVVLCQDALEPAVKGTGVQ